MLFLRLLVVILSHKCAVSAVLDEKCFDNCSCCIDEICEIRFDWPNVCTIGCMDGHTGARCYELCQYPNCKSCGGITNSTVCTECYDGYYLGPNKDCTPQCPSNCKSCTSSTECKTCESGFYEKTCNKSCPEGCLDSCSISTGECSNCQNNRFGQFCNMNCSDNCDIEIINNNRSCAKFDGACYGCIDGFFNPTCKYMCSELCVDRICRQYDGVCIYGCEGSQNQPECILGKEAHQQNVASNSGLIATAAVLGSMLMLSFSVNIVLLALFLLEKRKGSGRKHSWIEREPTYQNQLVDIAEQTPRTTRDATDTLHSETVERSVYEGISGVNEEEHAYQQVAHDHDTML